MPCYTYQDDPRPCPPEHIEKYTIVAHDTPNKDKEFDPSFNFIGNEFEFNPMETKGSFTQIVDAAPDTPSKEMMELRQRFQELANLKQNPDYPHWLELSAKLREHKQKLENSELELSLVSSFLCAILNELEATNNLIPTVLAAERNGKCDAILTWWKAHKNRDIQRLKTELNKHFSPQEIELLKKSLVGGNI